MVMGCRLYRVTRTATLALLLMVILLIEPEALSAQECAEYQNISLLLAIDISSSMQGPKLHAARDFALSIIDELNATGFLEEAASFQFCADIVAYNDWMDPSTLWTHLSYLSVTCADPNISYLDGTALYDAIGLGAQEIRTRSPANLRLFVVITDGEDLGSSFDLQQAANALSGGDIVARLVFIGDEQTDGSRALENIASGAGPAVDAYAAIHTDLPSLVDDIVAATCINFRPEAAISILPDSDLYLGTDGFDLTFDGSPSSDHETTSDSDLTFEWTITQPDGTQWRGLPDDIRMVRTFNDDQLPIGEVWGAELRVTDPQGASDTATESFEIIGSPPGITLSGSDIDVFQRLTVSADPPEDIDGGFLTFQWRVDDAPFGGTYSIDDTFDTRSVSFDTVEGDIGTWTLECTATDDEGVTDTVSIPIEVRNLPPEIHLVGDPVISIGESIHVETDILEDRDGGDLTFQWDIVQAPQSASLLVQERYQEGTGAEYASIDIPTTDDSYAGTWIFRLTATDDEDESTPQPDQPEEFTFTVVVDAPPKAEDITCDTCTAGSNTIGSLSFPLILDGSDSFDPDSPPPPPCPGSESDRCHDTLDGRAVTGVGPGVEYTWSLVDVPFELWGIYPLGRVDEVFGVSAHRQTLTLDFGDLEPGEWTFQLEVTDTEGNEDYTTFTVAVIDENGAPIAIASPPARYTVDPYSGALYQDITLSGIQSFDLDNTLLGDPLEPGLGISNYQWEVLRAPPGCTSPPLLSSLGQQDTVRLYAAGTTVDPVCQGRWNIRLTVTDDDSPSRTDSTETRVIIGNCPERLCIDYPTTLDPQSVKFTEDTDILIYYHLNSALYDEHDTPDFAYGLFAMLEIFHQSDLTTPVFTSLDPNVLASDRGGFLGFLWDGYSNSLDRPESGLYTVQITLLDFAFGPSHFVATEPNAIRIAVTEPRILPTSDTYVNFEELDMGVEQVTINYKITGDIVPDRVRWRIRDASGSVISEIAELPGLSGSIEWDGQVNGATVAPGVYTVELEAYHAGSSLGIGNPHEFVVYQLALAPTTGPVSDTPPGVFVFVNSDDDDLDNVADLTETAAGEDDLVTVTVTVEPLIEGVVTLSSDDASPPFKLWDTATKGTETALPATFNTPADSVPPQLFIEGQTAGQSNLSLELQTSDGVTLGPAAIALTAVEVQVMTDSDSNHTIGAGDAATHHVRIARWDNAYDATFNPRNNPDPNNFVEQDPSRFYLLIRDPAANADPAVREQITVQLGTLDAAGAVDDDLHNITLGENGDDSGEFVSRSQILTSHDIQYVDDPDADDSFDADDGLGWQRLDDTTDDRTHRTDIDGMLRIQYQPPGAPAAKTWDVPVCKRNPEERRTLEIKVTVFNEPFRDEGYDHDANPITPPIGPGNGTFDFDDRDGDGLHEPGERSEPFMDISSGAASFAHAGSRGGVVTEQQVREQVVRASIAWAQACVKVVLLSIDFADAPRDARGRDILEDGLFDTVADQAVVITTYAPGASEDVAEVFFVTFIAEGYAYMRAPGDNVAGLGEKTFIFMRPNLSNLRILAHEIGHALDNGYDNDNPQPIFYPANHTFRDTAVNSYRRLTQGTITDCRTCRQSGDMNGTGNQLLKPLALHCPPLETPKQAQTQPSLTPGKVQPQASATPSPTHPQQDETPGQVVEALLSLPHGFNKLSPDDRVQLERVIQDPDPYFDALESLYAGKDIAAIEDPNEILRLERAIMLLGLIGTPDATSQLAQWYAFLDSAAEETTDASNRGDILLRQRIVLIALGDTKQKDVIAHILDTLGKMDYATRIAAFQYLERSSVGDEEVINELDRYLNDERSPLYQDWALERALKWIAGQK